MNEAVDTDCLLYVLPFRAAEFAPGETINGAVIMPVWPFPYVTTVEECLHRNMQCFNVA